MVAIYLVLTVLSTAPILSTMSKQIDMPGHQNVRPDPQDDESPKWCRRHKIDYFDECEICARRGAAVTGLRLVLGKLTSRNYFDRRDAEKYLKRAIQFIEDET